MTTKMKRPDQVPVGHLASGGPILAGLDDSRRKGAAKSLQARRSIKKLADTPVVLAWGQHGK